MDELVNLVKNMKISDNISEKKKIIENIQKETCFTKKCILTRRYLDPQSAYIENIIKKDLLIESAIDKISGDGRKNGINYEIKCSVHAKQSKLNFVQIRPDHNIDYYILCYYNMYIDEIGKGYIFKVPSDNMYELIVKYGGYAHGTTTKLGKITNENLKGRSCEYALRCNPNLNTRKNKHIWNELLKYKVEYKAEKF